MTQNKNYRPTNICNDVFLVTMTNVMITIKKISGPNLHAIQQPRRQDGEATCGSWIGKTNPALYY